VHRPVVDLHAVLAGGVVVKPAQRVLHPRLVVTVGEVLTSVRTTRLLHTVQQNWQQRQQTQ
jgi:hypothetical protein